MLVHTDKNVEAVATANTVRLAVIKAIRTCNLRCPYCYYINENT